MLLSASNKIPYKEEVNYEKVAAQVSLHTSKQLEKEINLHACGVGGSMMDDVKVMALSFQYPNNLSITKGRLLIIHSIDKYLHNINNSDDLRPYLHNSPFNVNNVEIRIFGTNYIEGKLSIDNLFFISALNNTIEYYGFNIDGERCTLFTETYTEALEIVKNSPDETVALLNTSK